MWLPKNRQSAVAPVVANKERVYTHVLNRGGRGVRRPVDEVSLADVPIFPDSIAGGKVEGGVG